MVSELKVTINHRLSPDMNASFQVTHIVDDAADIEEAGREDNSIIMAWLKGFGDAAIEWMHSNE